MVVWKKQRGVLKGVESEWSEVTSVILRRSVLEPILFIIYVDDLNQEISSKLFKFAGDCEILISVNKHSDSYKFQKDLDRLKFRLIDGVWNLIRKSVVC